MISNTVGDYVIELTVTDTGGLTDTDTVTITATSGDQPPVTSFSAPKAVQRGNAASLYASSSNEPDGDTLSYAWSLIAEPSGSDAPADSTAEQTTLTAPAVGAYGVELQVTANGAMDTASQTIYSVEPTGGPCLICRSTSKRARTIRRARSTTVGAASVDLTAYRVCLSSNATTDCTSQDIDLTGTLAAGSVQTVCDPTIDTGVYSGTCDYSSAVASFNDDDRLLIYEDVDSGGAYDSGDTRVDAFGVTGTTPASGPRRMRGGSGATSRPGPVPRARASKTRASPRCLQWIRRRLTRTTSTT
jgi:hypothetical protein